MLIVCMLMQTVGLPVILALKGSSEMCLRIAYLIGISNKGGTTTPRPFPGGGSFLFLYTR
ncbi:hypothetical protein JCM10914A_05260 [Paenibacillus sp. JCM 10914]